MTRVIYLLIVSHVALTRRSGEQGRVFVLSKRNLVGLVLTAVLATTPARAQANIAELRELLTTPAVLVEMLEPWTPPRHAELNAKLSAAARSDPTWFREHLARALPGQPLPYDARLGLTESEYRELLALSSNLTMRATRSTTVHVSSTPNGWRFGPQNELSQLRDVEVDTLAHVVRTSYGILPVSTPVEASDEQRATGPWHGSLWSLSSPSLVSGAGVSATFALGRHESTGRLFLYYEAKELRAGAITRRVDLVLRAVR